MQTYPVPPVRVLGIAGSPRRRGNTETLLDQFIAGAQSAGARTEKVIVARLDIGLCVGCNKCFTTGRCALIDDFQELYDKLIAADVIVLAAPLYFWNVPAQTKALIDRSECQWARKFVLKTPLAATPAGNMRRRGIFISAAGQPDANFEGSKQTIKTFFDVWEADYWGELLYGAVDAKGDIDNHPTSLREAFSLGQTAVSGFVNTYKT
jgi:NAD(P)H-dependent FMN reductase